MTEDDDKIYIAHIYWQPVLKYTHLHLVRPDGETIMGQEPATDSWNLAEVFHIPADDDAEAIKHAETWYEVAREEGETVLTVHDNPARPVAP